MRLGAGGRGPAGRKDVTSALAAAAAARQGAPEKSGTAMTSFQALLLAALVLAGGSGPLRAQPAPGEPIEIAQLPYIEIFSPTFFWSDEADFMRVGSINCPKGRAVTGGVSIAQGQASLRILESYPDGESWVTRVVNRQKGDKVQSLQVRGFALCMLPAARKASVLWSQHPKLVHLSTKFGLAPGYASSTGRQACPRGALPVAGGFGIDPAYHGPALARLELSYPDPDGWNVRAVNGATGSGAADARAYAVCLGLSNGEGIDIRDYHSVYFATKDVPVKSAGGTAKQSVGCGDGAYVLAGGARTSRGRSANVEIGESFPDTPSSWTTAVTNRGDKKAGDVTVKMYAVCLKK
jgi:hypothetical protein